MGDGGPSESQVGDDPAFEGDEGVGYGNINTTTEQALRDDPNIGGDDFTAADAAAARAEIQKQQSQKQDTQTQDSGSPIASIQPPDFGTSDVFDPQTMQSRFTPTPEVPEVKGTPSFTPFGDPTIVQSFLPAEVKISQTAPQTKQERGLAAIANMLTDTQARKAGMVNPEDIRAGIDFGVTAPIPSTVGDDFGPALDMVDARTQAANQQKGQIPTDTRASEDYEENVGRRFDPNAMADIERLYNLKVGQGGKGTGKDPNFIDSSKGTDPAFFENLGVPTPLAFLGDFIEKKSRENMATEIALGRPMTLGETLFGFNAGTMAVDKQGRALVGDPQGTGRFTKVSPSTTTKPMTMEDYMANTQKNVLNEAGDTEIVSRRLGEEQLVRNDSGRVIGIRDKSGRLVSGMDPDEEIQQGDDGGSDQTQRRVVKPPTDPCPEGYILIDGKCTPIADATAGIETGFRVFPTNRDPAYSAGPFSPSTVATSASGIRGLNPITFNPFNK